MKIALIGLIQMLLLPALAPLFLGILKKIKCRLQNRSAPSIFLPYQNLRKLFCKDLTIAKSASPLFYFVPYLQLTLMIVIAGLLPVLMTRTLLGVAGDAILLVGLFALSRFFLALAGLDIGTAFGGMGSSREMMIASMAEPALMMIIFTIAVMATSTQLSMMVNQTLQSGFIFHHPSFIFAASGFILVALAETGRIPFDNPTTHLELTMVHEAMILEYSGRHLALIEWASATQWMIYAVLFIDLFLPWGLTTQIAPLALFMSFVVLFGKLLLLCVALAIAETHLAKARLFRAPYLLNMAFLLSLLGLLMHILLEVG